MVLETRNLQSQYPEIAKEWDYEKNGDLLPSQVSKSSAVRVWWKCEKDHLREQPDVVAPQQSE